MCKHRVIDYVWVLFQFLIGQMKYSISFKWVLIPIHLIPRTSKCSCGIIANWCIDTSQLERSTVRCQSSIVRCYSVYHCIPCFHHCVECTSFASWNHILCGGMWITIHFEYVHISYDSHRMAWYSRFWSHHTFLLNFNSLPFYLVLVILHLFVLQTTKQNVRLELCTKGNYNFLSYHNFSFEHFFSKYLFQSIR